MSHTIKQSKHSITTPTGLYEANYRRLMRLVPDLCAKQVNDKYCLSAEQMTLKVLQQYKYTTVISFQHSLHIPGNTVNFYHEDYELSHLQAIDMELRVCHDACLLEVIAYQGKSPIHSSQAFPAKHLLQRDEKRQLNLFLKELLEKSLRTEYHHKPLAKLSF
ncbi:DUF1249 domain-containing protein [sulfur-oxidizing endosymbiont of Gigantopelta aegis]|uniref:DUF1249 domain-containing protein n=1 Tax=sulfur-oxidizing endosymbiont of Gigantopelta aegis TaxID=2794934 RepID=UPI0018DBD5DF|nr:DUF1249 domain-containing protein [sulfur-oxidizing endosymbiont of Gigantopelta aegis]